MIRSKDLNKEVKALEDKVTAGKCEVVDVVKALCLLVKAVRDIRTNQVLGLRKAGVELIKPDTDTTKEG